MKTKFIIAVFFIYSLAFSQQEASVWYFGNNAGIKFDSSGNVTALIDGQLDSIEGCATISDSSGNLLFYTEGSTIWNKLHQQMPNGYGLMGTETTTQSATIVPLPGSTTIYYVFTLDYEAHPNGFRYSIVDMSLNGGLGDVTSVKNILIYTPSNEKMSVIKHANDHDYWIVTHGWNNNTFYSYLLTSSGLSVTPVTSNVGTVISGTTDNTWGCMKISPDGSKLAIANGLFNFELMDYDIATGLVSNPQILLNYHGAYGIEFSPDSKVLYASITDPSPYKLIQFDLTASSVSSSAQILFSSSVITPVALQLAPNNKIYFAQFDSTKLGLIANPNVLGTGCTVQINAVDLSGRLCSAGLPSFITSLFNGTFKAQNLCLGSVTTFTLDNSLTVTNASWNFGDGTTSTILAPTHIYASAGTYTVTVTVTTANGVSTKTKVITIYEIPIADAIANQTQCDSLTATYDLSQHNSTVMGSQSTSSFGVNYYSTMTDLVNHTNALPIQYNLPLGTTTIYAKVYNIENTNCYAFQSFTVTKYLKPIANSVASIFVCDDASNDGLGSFNLGVTSSTVLGAQSSNDVKVSYHLNQNDANNGNNPLPLNYQNASNPQTIYIRVENKLSSNCYDASQSFQIGLYKMPTANQPPNLYQCDAGNDNIESFDLTPQSSLVLGNQMASDYTITYHNSQNDADFGLNPLTMIQLVFNAKTIYVRIENKLSSTCYATTSFQLIIKAKPVIAINDTYTICQGNTMTITAPSGFTSYNWSTSSHINTNVVTQSGNYSLTVTKDYGTIICDETKNFTVVNSNIATITSITTEDWTNNENEITVFTTGDGDYEYSLDNSHFQDSNQFYGLQSGEYTVYVKDKKGCGMVQKEVFLLMYPKFFTPNGDNTNDRWKIKFSKEEPNMQIKIYDRFGKLLKELKPENSGWDGTYNGVEQISDDYWFMITREDGKEFRGHFTLKR